MITGAAFSPCRNYRYVLYRIWNENKPYVMFIGLNPSTANATTDDPTIRRVVKIAYNNGYGGVYMANLFGIISPYPSILKTCKDPIGDNDKWLDQLFFRCKDVVFAWGNFKEAEERAKEIIKRYPEAKALKINKNGSPKHPLYVSTEAKLIEYKL